MLNVFSNKLKKVNIGPCVECCVPPNFGFSSPLGNVVADNLWLDFRPQYTSGSIAVDLSGNGRDANLYNTATVQATPTGEMGFYTDGVSGAVQYRITNSSQKPPLDYNFSVESWMYRYDESTANRNWYIAEVGHAWITNHRRFHVALGLSDAATVDNQAAAGYFNTNSTNQYATTYNERGDMQLIEGESIVMQDQNPTCNHQWYHLVGCYYLNSSGHAAIDFYINGVPFYIGWETTKGGDNSFLTAPAVPWYGSVSSSNPISWGYGFTNLPDYTDPRYNGYGGDYRMYTSRLTGAQVLNNFEATKGNYGY